MKDFIYSEKFDNYLKGKLQTNEKYTFEEKLHRDPLLRNEVKLQQEIYHSLGEARRSYLKSRLDQVPINSGAWYNFTGMQWAAVVSSFLILTGGSYFYFAQSDSNTEGQKSITSVNITIPKKNQRVPLEKIEPALSFPQFNEDENMPDDETLTASSKVLVKDTNEKASEVNKENILQKQEFVEEKVPKIVRPDVLSSFHENSRSIDYSDFELPDKKLLQESEASVSEVEVETILNSNYSFHYQLVNHKLYLHGDFQGIPYKIIALNQNETKKLFLEFNGDFYKLREEQQEITPLEIIKDSTIINALTKLSH